MFFVKGPDAELRKNSESDWVKKEVKRGIKLGLRGERCRVEKCESLWRGLGK